ncbi:MAG: hypothetical protein K0R26_1961 [Bacteroidota bacterium]|jgi:hypothetical protein|nr:hypothetical protein [Bacteroidota bacterium]
MEQLIDKIENIHVSMFSQRYIKNKSKQKTLTDKIDIDIEISNWITLKQAWDCMQISRLKWYRKFQHVIKHKNYGGDVWVYKPSIYEFFTKDNIN